MNTLKYLIVFLIFSSNLNSQELIYYNVNSSPVFRVDGNKISLKEVKTFISSNPKALKYFNKALFNEAILYTISIPSITYLSYCIFYVNDQENLEQNWNLIGLSIGSLIFSFSLKIDRNFKKAVDEYNGFVTPKKNFSLSFNYNGNNAGVSLKW